MGTIISGILTCHFVLIYALAQANNVVAAWRGDPPEALPDELAVWTALSLASLAAFAVFSIFSSP